ncbi:MAG TPA: FISUMP domain-containing protein, partial [Chitinophagales bacterium]|nr:FISUMP domain-containing protein [Chitinophagales bacterium]
MSKNIFIVAVLLLFHHVMSIAQTFTCGDTLTDARDGKKYATILIGTECWFKDNLNYGTLVQSTESTVLHSEQTNNGIAEKYAQQNNANNLLIYGGLYEQAELMNYTNTTNQGLCPAGWHVSTDQEWQKLIIAAGGTLVSPNGGHGGNALKKMGEGWGAGAGTDAVGIGLKHGGDRDGYGIFYGMGQRSIYWTSTPAGAQQAYHYTLWADNDTIQRLALGTSTTGFSCRCVKDQSTTGTTGPWQSPLMMAWSSDGINFDTPMVFQDSSGVPSVIHWRGDTLVAVFQWFRQPIGSSSWDRVGVKFSYDAGQTWTTPTPIVVQGMPASYQRPFDPTLATFAGGDSLRIYFSSSSAMPNGLDSTINTYSAKSIDGIYYTFEPNARVDVNNNRVIDPAVVYFNNAWHYAAPLGSPQQ